MKTLIPLALLFVTARLFSACNKDGSSTLASPAVYVVGAHQNTSGIDTALYWKNGSSVALTDESEDAIASGIYVSCSDVYVIGVANNSSHVSVAKYWKNGSPVILTDGTRNASANGIVVK